MSIEAIKRKTGPATGVICGGLVRLARRSCISLVLPVALTIVTVIEAWRCARNIPSFIRAGWSAEIRAAKNQWRV